MATILRSFRPLSTLRLRSTKLFTTTAHAKHYVLPEGFLGGPAPNLTRKDVEWKKGGVSEHEGKWVTILDGVESLEECDALLAAAEATTDGSWERAQVNIGQGRQASIEDIRKCGRIIWDDRAIVEKLWARIASAVPDIHELQNWADVTGPGPAKRGEIWTLTQLNHRMRYLKYVGGEYFKPHCDGNYETPDQSERSYFTLHLYLNGAADQLQGGATTFFSQQGEHRMDIAPKVGRVLLFQHRRLLHSGDDVVKGTKYTMRTDILYKLDGGKDGRWLQASAAQSCQTERR